MLARATISQLQSVAAVRGGRARGAGAGVGVDVGAAGATLVLGLGKTGYSVVEFLAGRGEEAIVVADTREAPPFLAEVREGYPQVEVVTGGLPHERFGEFGRVVVSPGVVLPAEAGEAGGDEAKPRVVSDVEVFAENARAPIVAITGSNGKSTVTMLVGEMLRAAGKVVRVGGNLGTPALELLGKGEGEAKGEADFYVLELSSFQLEHTHNLRAAAVAVLNICEDHLDRYEDVAAYAAAKRRILRGAGARVLNREDGVVGGWLEEAGEVPSEVVSFGLDAPPREVDYGVVGGDLVRGGRKIARAEAMGLRGGQNVANGLAALALVEAVAGGEITDAMVGAMLGYRGLEHRCEWVAEIGGVQWVNDSKGTNVGATRAAIAGLEGGLVLIAGGRGKGADFAPLAEAARGKVRCAILFGEDAGKLAGVFAGVGGVEVERVEDLRAAVMRAAGVAGGGETVLFSPACASFDMFENYEARGAAFKELVAEVAEIGGAGEGKGKGKEKGKVGGGGR